MNRLTRNFLLAAICSMAAICTTVPAGAHFVWLKTIPQGDKQQAFLFFGESPADEAYHFPEKLSALKISLRKAGGEPAQLASEKIENDDRVGLVAALPTEGSYVLETTGTYGLYGNSLLTYYAKHIAADSNDKLATADPSKALKLEVLPREVDGKLQLTVLWDGKPLADCNATVTVGDGDTIEQTTDTDGHVTISPETSGLAAVLVNHVEKGVKGELDGKPYTSSAHYASLTFDWLSSGASATAVEPTEKKSADALPTKASPEADQTASRIPALPEPLSSFGGAVSNGWLYVYGGHIGKEHDHSAANLSQHFRRARIDGGQEWEELPMQTPLQGLPLVVHTGRLYRVGGLNARNATPKDDEQLFSTEEFAEFDPALNKWTALAPLPERRSSHDAVVIGDKLYVVGGWTLSGPRKGEWLDDALVYDFTKQDAGWQKLPQQSFRRRALAAGQWQGKIVALGGMDEDTSISQRVDVFDPSTGEWSAIADLPGEDMAGFGVSAWNLHGNLYACGCQGTVYRLQDDGANWEEVARLAKPRFFHRLLPAGPNALLVVGGASSDGHIAGAEWIELSKDKAPVVDGN